ncbi:DUF4270 family protein [Sphingobacterium psychroaquaticum]|uniref:Uncharacterized protein n=1 Tax=Sphingobacterium psychroaquaticum TaxID=561061 RepID=A0A1X7KYH0_9SPHI|nr:DUF4270 family protein [Sphingobacterium psychroaquaticum]QBQ39695.1 DUF4270 family protein [Sphingobacterium psychroaquaticum]SMG46460.1 protein of unknown function [Sphingobacterium psychroaquaticum]
MNQFLKRTLNKFALPIFTLIVASACDKDMSVMLDNSATSNVGVSAVDSFTVHTSTVQLDNMPSSATGAILVGKAVIPNLGSVQSTSYFRLGFTSFTNDIPTTAVFDSLNLVLKPSTSRYYYGDTTKVQKFSVHKISEPLETTTLTGGIQNTAIPIYVTGPSIFSKRKFTYETSELGALSFTPHIRAIDSLDIKLNSGIGKEIFDMIQANDIKVASNENFQEYFNGLALVPDKNNSAVIALSDTLQFKINYSYTGTDGFKKTGAKVLVITQRDFQYNNISYDRTGTAFESLSLTNKEVKTSATGGVTFVQSGAGVVAKLSFPSLKDFILDETVSVNKAELVIETSTPSMNTMYPIPGSLMLFVADHDGIPVSYITAAYGSGIQQAGFKAGNQTGRNGTYTFNLISYLKTLKSTSTYDDKTLYLSTVTPGLFSTFNTAVIATEQAKPKIKLNILYTKFK